MKLRMHGDSIRFRLSADEVAKLTQSGSIREEIVFGPHSSLAYQLRLAAEAPEITASMEAGQIMVEIPKPIAMAWASGQECGISAEQSAGNGKTLTITVEKEFECLHGPKEEGRELFPNPKRQLL